LLNSKTPVLGYSTLVFIGYLQNHKIKKDAEIALCKKKDYADYE